MDFNDVVLCAQEQVLQDLISGERFRGLGTTAKLLVYTVATPANENAIALYGPKTARTSENYGALVAECQQQFVMDVLGFSNTREAITPQQAAFNLVERVYGAYAEWSRVGNNADWEAGSP